MFIQRLYRYHKGLFIFFVAFLLLFIFINFKQGAVITPVYQYGMFSDPFYLKDAREAYAFTIDGVPLELEKYSFPARDILLVSLSNYLESRHQNQQVLRAIQPIIGRWVTLPRSLSRSASPGDFNKWYVETVSKLTKLEINRLEVYRTEIFWNGALVVKPQSIKIFPIAE